MARGGERDPDAPNDEESMLFWSIKRKSEDDVDKSVISASMEGRVQAQDILGALHTELPRAAVAHVTDAAGLLVQTAASAASKAANMLPPPAPTRSLVCPCDHVWDVFFSSGYPMQIRSEGKGQGQECCWWCRPWTIGAEAGREELEGKGHPSPRCPQVNYVGFFLRSAFFTRQ